MYLTDQLTYVRAPTESGSDRMLLWLKFKYKSEDSFSTVSGREESSLWHKLRLKREERLPIDRGSSVLCHTLDIEAASQTQKA